MSKHTSLTTGLITAAESLLQHGLPDQAAACLQAAIKLNPACLSAHNALESKQLPGALGPAFGINGVIHPNDDIFHFFASHPSSANPIRDYLSDGWRTLSELQSILSQLGLQLAEINSFLEFASGHGRFTRHLVKQLPAGSLTVSDVVPGSVSFLMENMKVKGFNSTLEPENLQFSDDFELIFVLSLFSHLPTGLWERWLQKLFDALRPGGCLILTTHGVYSARQLGVELQDDYLFISDSESSQIDSASYGSTFTGPEYVQRAIQSCCANIAFVRHFPAHFWSNQDAWVLAKQ